MRFRLEVFVLEFRVTQQPDAIRFAADLTGMTALLWWRKTRANGKRNTERTRTEFEVFGIEHQSNLTGMYSLG